MTPTKKESRRRSLVNLSKMGHCAPTVMQTMLDLGNTEGTTEQEWLVKLVAGLPGGIGNMGFECGGVTAPVVLLGLCHGLGHEHDGLPLVLYQGHDLCERFLDCNKTLLCSEIRGDHRVPTPCIGVILRAPELHAETLSRDSAHAITGEKRQAYRRLYCHLVDRGFHCSHAVFNRLRNEISVSQELLDATSGFMGGTLFKGMTCSALTAGVMAVGVRIGKIENSRARVMRMIARMIVGGNAFADEINEFNRSMNIGQRMAHWFTDQFGDTQCRAITQCDFSSAAGVAKYIESDCVTRCRGIADAVGEKVQSIIDEAEASGRAVTATR